MTETAFIPLLHFHRFVLSILDQVLLLCRCIGRAGGGEFADRHRATGQVPAPRRRRGRRQEPDAGADGTGAGEAGRGGRRHEDHGLHTRAAQRLYLLPCLTAFEDSSPW